MRYCIIITTYNPPYRVYKEIGTLTKFKYVYKIFIADSSPDPIRNRLKLHNSKIEYIRIKRNKGPGYNYNVALKVAKGCGCDLVTLLDDDFHIVRNRFKPNEIVDYFYKNCNPLKDLLNLPIYKSNYMPPQEYNRFLIGMTFSTKLIPKFKFREEFVLDFVDCDFSYQIFKNGGKNLFFNKKVISMLPSGRLGNNKFEYTPYWRLYLMARNTLVRFLENHDKITFLDLLTPIYWANRGRKAGQRTTKLVYSIISGWIDAISGNLGITRTLQKLSGNRFDA